MRSKLERDLRCGRVDQPNGSLHDLFRLARVQLRVTSPDLGPGSAHDVELQQSRDSQPYVSKQVCFLSGWDTGGPARDVVQMPRSRRFCSFAYAAYLFRVSEPLQRFGGEQVRRNVAEPAVRLKRERGCCFQGDHTTIGVLIANAGRGSDEVRFGSHDTKRAAHATHAVPGVGLMQLPAVAGNFSQDLWQRPFDDRIPHQALQAAPAESGCLPWIPASYCGWGFPGDGCQ